MRKQFDEFVSSTTIHGVNKAGDFSLSRRRYIWMILTLAMTGALVAFIVEAFINFFKYTTITQVSAENKRNIDFPAVTVCNMNMVKNTITQCNGSVFANLDTLFLNYGETLVIEDRLTSELGYVVGEDPNGEEMLKCLYEYSNKVHEMMPICTWKGTLMNCSDLFQTTLTEMGVCFTFNGEEGQRLQASYTGPDGGLRMFVDIGQLNYYYSATIQAGIKVVLHDPGTDPLPSMGGFLVAPGLSAEAIISKTRKSFLGDPYGKCLKVSESGNPLKRYSFYSEKSCRMECMIDHLVSGNESCRNCRHFLHPGPERLCEYKELEKCFVFYRTSNFATRCRCHRPCYQNEYKTSISYARFMSDFMYKYFVGKDIFLTSTYAKDNYIELKIYYDSLIETAVTEVPEFNIFEMLSNIGGLMGIFLGASLLSMVELVEFFLLIMSGRNKLGAMNNEASRVENGNVSNKTEQSKIIEVKNKQKPKQTGNKKNNNNGMRQF